MELYAGILQKLLEDESIVISFPDLEVGIKDIFEMECYIALEKIKAILEDDSLDDPYCFVKIEEIIHVFETMGSDCGTRHDF
nr:hypothetical protein [uncultured Solibaculum sp.]